MAKNQVADHPQTQMQAQTEPERSVARRNSYYPFPSSPSIEVRENDNNLIVSADLPGIDPKDVMVEVDNGVLVIRGERRREHSEQHEGYRRTERSYGSFHRAIPLPEGARTDDAKADFRNGVLEIKVPIEEARSHRKPIPIQSGNWASGASGGSQR